MSALKKDPSNSLRVGLALMGEGRLDMRGGLFCYIVPPPPVSDPNFPGTRCRSLARRLQMLYMSGPRVNCSFVICAVDRWSPADWALFFSAVFGFCMNFDVNGICVAKIKYWSLTQAQLAEDGHVVVNDLAELDLLPFDYHDNGFNFCKIFVYDEWTAPTIASTWGRTMSSWVGCSGGAVVKLGNGTGGRRAAVQIARTIAHEVGHYVGWLLHDSDPNNLMTPTGQSGTGVALTSSQVWDIKDSWCSSVDLP